jgi:hypothetical protein
LLPQQQYDFFALSAPRRAVSMSVRPWVFGMLSLAMGGAAMADGRGLVVDPERLSWPALQARVQLSTEPLAPTVGVLEGTALRPRSAALFGDYYLSRPFFGNTGGVRLTSGVVTGPRGAVFGPGQATAPAPFGFSSASRGVGSTFADANGESTQTLPYLGIGYSGGSLRGGWGFSADLGLTAQNNGNQRLVRSMMSQTLDDTLRELRFTPVLQLGVSYRF